MPVTEATCSLINVGLLSLKCPMSLKLSDFVASSDVLLDIMNWLLVELSICWQDLEYSIAHSVTKVSEVLNALDRRCPLTLRNAQFDSCTDIYQLLQFMISSLQLEKLVHHQSVKLAHQGYTGKALFQLCKIAKLLNMTTPVGQFGHLQLFVRMTEALTVRATELIDAIHARDDKVNDAGLRLCGVPLVIQETEIIPLSDAGVALVTEIENGFYEEYILRRKMLLRRLDVTIESFLGSSGNANNNNNNKADTSSVQVVSQPVYDMIKTHQRYLEEAPTFYAKKDALEARVSLLQEMSRISTTGGSSVATVISPSASSSSCVLTATRRRDVKSILVGAMPDRGGRTREIRPKHFEGGGGRGGGGGGGGRGGGGGGRGGAKGRGTDESNGRGGGGKQNGSRDTNKNNKTTANNNNNNNSNAKQGDKGAGGETKQHH